MKKKAWNTFPRPTGAWRDAPPTIRKLCEMAAGVRGSLFATKFYHDMLLLVPFLDGTDDEAAICAHYQVILERDGKDYAQAFVHTWLTFNRVITGIDRYRLNHPKKP